jgi:hypothetical protein
VNNYLNVTWLKGTDFEEIIFTSECRGRYTEYISLLHFELLSVRAMDSKGHSVLIEQQYVGTAVY